MLPEISRRCLSCGAAVRAGSRFCPQCGNELEAEARPATELEAEAARAAVPQTGEWSPQEQAAAPTNTQAAPTTKDWTPPTKEFAAFEESSKAAAPQSPPTAPVAAAASDDNVGVGAPGAVEEEAGEAGRAADLRNRVARVREGTRARVGRMREEAIVVLEETPDDSGLRFVLIAAALFVVFLVLLFLSTTVLR